jgi:hypothetical protein
MQRFKAILSVQLLTLSVGALAHADCLDFERANPGASFAVADTFVLADRDIEFWPFLSDAPSWSFGGHAHVDVSNNAAGTASQELRLTNIVMRNIFASSPQFVTFAYADLGGNVNLSINGAFRGAQDLSDLDGLVIGGVFVTVSRTDFFGGHLGEVVLAGPVASFSMGGSEFWVDDICALQI